MTTYHPPYKLGRIGLGARHVIDARGVTVGHVVPAHRGNVGIARDASGKDIGTAWTTSELMDIVIERVKAGAA